MFALHRTVRALCCAAALVSATAVSAYYEAPWSSFNFFQDQTWTSINNRLTNERMATMRKDAGLTGGKRKSSAPAPAKSDRSVLALGNQASENLAPLRPYLATTQLSEANAAKVLAMYNDVATKLGVPYNDSASGMAAFLAGTYAAYTNKPFPDEYFKPLYEQFAESMSSGGSLAATPLAERTEYYQRMVVAGMLYQLLQLDMQQKPDAQQIAAMRKAAGSAFRELAGRGPDQIQFTAQGMRPR